MLSHHELADAMISREIAVQFVTPLIELQPTATNIMPRMK